MTTLNAKAVTRLLSTWDVKYGKPRGTIKPRLVILHTNGGGGPASIAGVVNGAENGGTQPHFQAQGGYGRDGDTNIYQLLPTDREGVGSWNADGFCITIETQDAGWPTPGSIPWSPPQFEAIAQVVAVECQRWGIPVRIADRWDGAGIGYHRQWGINTVGVTSKGEGLPIGSKPGYVNPWTKTVGKVCPGDARVAQMPALVARVAEIIAPPPSKESDVDLVRVPGTTAQFLRGAQVEWISNGDRANGLAVLYGQPKDIKPGELKLYSLLGDLPVGDVRPWTESDFAGVIRGPVGPAGPKGDPGPVGPPLAPGSTLQVVEVTK